MVYLFCYLFGSFYIPRQQSARQVEAIEALNFAISTAADNGAGFADLHEVE